MLLGLDGTAKNSIDDIAELHQNSPLAIVLGAEGPGLRELTKQTCDELVKIDYAATVWLSQRLECNCCCTIRNKAKVIANCVTLFLRLIA